MKTIGEHLNGQYVLLDCPYCDRKQNQRVTLGRIVKCKNSRCVILIDMQQDPSGDILTTFSVDPEEVNAAAIEVNIMSKKIKKDLESNDYSNTIN